MVNKIIALLLLLSGITSLLLGVDYTLKVAVDGNTIFYSVMGILSIGAAAYIHFKGEK
ncbi:MAG: hypothetical protein AAF806_06460 [Bacteroidota bacterium]